MVRTWCCFLLSLAPAFAQTTLNLSEDLVKLGIATNNMAPNQQDQDSGPLFVAGVQYAQNHQIATVIADPGAYYFLNEPPGCHVSIPNLVGMTIDLQGSDLYFADVSVAGICPTNGTNVTLQNFTIDYLNLPFTQLLITSINVAQLQVQVNIQPGYPTPSSLNTLLTPGVTPTAYIFRDGQPWPLSDRFRLLTPLSDNQITFDSDAATLAQMRLGDVVVVTAANGGASSIAAVPCSGCTLRNIRIFAGGEGPWALEGESELVERVYVMPKPGTDRLVSCGGESMQLTGPNNTLRLNRFIRIWDEGPSGWVSFYGSVQSVIGSQTLQLQGGGIGPSSAGDTLAQGRAMPNNTPVTFQRVSDGSILGSAVVVSQTPAPPINGLNQMIITFDRDLPSNLLGSYMYPTDPNQRGGNTLYELNTVQQQLIGPSIESYGLMNSVISGNYTRRTPWAGIWVDGHTDTGYGATPPPQNIVVNNNVVDGPNSFLGAPTSSSGVGAVYTSEGWGLAGIQTGEVSLTGFAGVYAGVANVPGLLQNITVSNNFVFDSGRSAVLVSNTANSSVSGNYLLDSNINPRPEIQLDPTFSSDILQPLVLNLSSNVSTTGNTIDQTSGRIWVTDTQYNELVAYAPGSVYRLNAYNLGTLPSPTVTLTDANGTTATLAIQKTSTHAIDVQLAATASLGGAYLTLTSGSVKYFGTLFLDSQDNILALNGCTYEASLSSASVPSGASSFPILAVTQAGCPIPVLATDSFVTAPASETGTGVVSFGFAANTGPPRSTTIEIAGQQISVAQAGQLPIIQAIYDSWNYASGVAPGAWVTIGGIALAYGAPQSFTYTGTQTLPTVSNGTMVLFDGTPAALLYVSPTQINVLVPSTIAPGPVQVIVQSSGVNSAVFMIDAAAALPAIYALPSADGSSFFVTSALQGTGFLVGNSAVDPRVLRAAQPGDILDLYMIGLGATADPSQFLTNQNFAGAYPVSAQVTATVGSEPAAVLFAGLTSPGLYLVRITVPSDLPAGQSAIQISLDGVETSSNLILMLQGGPQANLIRNGNFESPLTGIWNLDDDHNGAVATAQVAISPAVSGGDSAEISVTSSGSPAMYSNVQFWQAGFPVQQGHLYVLRFSAMADAGRTMQLNVVQNGGTFQTYGLASAVGLATGWLPYVIYFQATATDAAARLDFYFGAQTGNTWLDAVVLQDTSQ